MQGHDIAPADLMRIAQMFDEPPSSAFDDDNLAYGYGEHRHCEVHDKFFYSDDVGSQDGDESMDHGF